MVQPLAVTDYIDSLAIAEQEFGIYRNNDPAFFIEWCQNLPELNTTDHPPFRLRSEASIRLELEDKNGTIYQGRINSLVLQNNLWIVLVESKRTSFSTELALPQAIAYMAANPDRDRPTFGLVSNGAYSIFIKLHQGQYDFSEDFSLNRLQNKLYGVFQGLNRLKM